MEFTRNMPFSPASLPASNGEKSPSSPGDFEILGPSIEEEINRLCSKLDVLIKGLLPTDKGKSEQTVKQGKAMCTFGNTLNCDITTALE